MKKLNTLYGFIGFGLMILSLNVFSQNALHFDGLNDRVNCGNPTAVQITGNHITLEAWIKPTAFGPNVWTNNIINKETWSPEAGYMLRCGASGKLNFNIGNGQWHEITSSAVVLTLNIWQHVAATYDGSYLRLYVNGIITDSSSVVVSSISNAAANLTIGDYAGGGRYFSGGIDEVRVWSVARTKAQINADMNNEICGGVNGLKAYYRFNSGTANGNNAGIISAIDYTGNSTTSSLTNFALTGTTSNWITGVNLGASSGTTQDTIYDVFCLGSVYQFGNQQLTAAGTYNETFFSSNGCDSIITLVLTSKPTSSSSYADTICNGDVYSFGSQSLTTTGLYNEHFMGANGCDSIVSLSLYVMTVFTNVTVVNQTTLSANAINATYQWVDCDNGYAAITGATSSIFSPSQDGNYAVIITQNNCSDTSICFQITGTSINYINRISQIRIHPNPISDFLFISNMNQNNCRIEIYNIQAQKVGDMISNKREIQLNMIDYPKSIYFIKIITSNEIRTFKVIKE